MSEHTPPLRDQARPRWLAISAATVGGVLLLDQATKSLVRARLERGETWPEGWELIRIAHVTNTGAAFGMLQDATLWLTLATIAASVVIAGLIYSFAARHRSYALCLSLILGGALGNLVDRIRLGAVTDFIDPMAYPAFNVADSAIVIGVAALLLLTLFERPERADDPVGELGEPAPATERARRDPPREAS